MRNVNQEIIRSNLTRFSAQLNGDLPFKIAWKNSKILLKKIIRKLSIVAIKLKCTQSSFLYKNFFLLFVRPCSYG